MDGVEVNWPAPAWVRTLSTTRYGGVSQGPWASLNLGDHCGDLPEHVQANRQQVARVMGADPLWLKQVHGKDVVCCGVASTGVPMGDAALTVLPHHPVGVLTADCLPVLLCHESRRVVAVAHAGWRGLVAGVIEATVRSMDVDVRGVLAWLGPAIGPDAFEVGPEVREAFLAQDERASWAFRKGQGDRWLADLYQLARGRLGNVGVERVYGGGLCTVKDARFFSYRREGGVTGRMGHFIWMVEGAGGASV